MKKLLLAVVALAVLYGGFYVYADMEGYPWKRAQIQKDAVRYMKEKYGMDAKSAGSAFNFKFDTYIAKVYDVREGEERIIRVERNAYYDESGPPDEPMKRLGERLEDNYAEVYWGLRAEERLREAFPRVYGNEDIDRIRVSTTYRMQALEEGLSEEMDADGVRIPAKPTEGLQTWDIQLVSKDFSEALLGELVTAIRQMREFGPEADLNVYTALAEEKEGETRGKTKYLNLEFEKFGTINGIEDLRAALSEY